MRTATHPARSPEFLSRLHDGDLTAAERAHFESHRAHCGECRHAAAEFEAALSLFRSSRTSPAGPDLAGRILRRLQAATPRRRPFGVFYGIDLRWAAAFAAALIAMIIGSAVVMRQTPPRVPTGPTSIPVTPEGSQSREREDDRARQNSRASAPPKAPAPSAGAAPAREEAKDRGAAAVEPAAPERAAAANPEEPAREQGAKAVASAKEESEKLAAFRKREEASGRISSRDEPSGGERSAATAPDFAPNAAAAPPLVFEITPIDGEGSPPMKIAEPRLSAEYRDRQFILVVGVDGRVLNVLPALSDERRDADQQSAATGIPEALKDLRFEVGNRPRRLLLSLR